MHCFIVEDVVLELRVEVDACWMNNWGSEVRRRTAGRLFWNNQERVERCEMLDKFHIATLFDESNYKPLWSVYN